MGSYERGGTRQEDATAAKERADLERKAAKGKLSTQLLEILTFVSSSAGEAPEQLPCIDTIQLAKTQAKR